MSSQILKIWWWLNKKEVTFSIAEPIEVQVTVTRVFQEKERRNVFLKRTYPTWKAQAQSSLLQSFNSVRTPSRHNSGTEGKIRRPSPKGRESEREREARVMEEDEGSSKVETAKAERSVWLMKCPVVVAKSWQAHPPSDPLAKVVLSLDPLRPPEDPSSLQVLSLSLSICLIIIPLVIRAFWSDAGDTNCEYLLGTCSDLEQWGV